MKFKILIGKAGKSTIFFTLFDIDMVPMEGIMTDLSSINWPRNKLKSMFCIQSLHYIILFGYFCQKFPVHLW